MSVGKVFKGASIVLFILDIVISIDLGNQLGYYRFNQVIFVCGLLFGLIFCLLIYALGEIMDQLRYSKHSSKEIVGQLEYVNHNLEYSNHNIKGIYARLKANDPNASSDNSSHKPSSHSSSHK